MMALIQIASGVGAGVEFLPHRSRSGEIGNRDANQ